MLRRGHRTAPGIPFGLRSPVQITRPGLRGVRARPISRQSALPLTFGDAQKPARDERYKPGKEVTPDFSARASASATAPGYLRIIVVGNQVAMAGNSTSRTISPSITMMKGITPT